MKFTLDSNNPKMIVALGNIGKQYDNTRHNAGFMFLDYITDTLNLTASLVSEKDSDLMNMKRYQNPNLITLKPYTLMNSSGKAVREAIKYHNFPHEDILLIHDDLDIPLGKSKMQLGVSPKDHKGVISVEQQMGSKDFLRLRIGIENRQQGSRIPGEDYVLQKFSDNEKVMLKTSFAEILDTYFEMRAIA
ncbi:MAG: aminoacyl-tRNA hydrolase [Candidatus Dojkabacteria bacterium]